MADNNSFFRPEIFEAKKNKWTGHVVMTRPFSFVFLTGCAASAAAAILLFAFFGSYTRKTNVEGQLMPVSGLVRVYPADTGIVTEKMVKEGDFVQEGDVLLKLSMPRYNGEGNIRDRLVKEAEAKKEMLLHEIERQKKLQEGEARTASDSVSRLENQLADVRGQI